MRRTLGCLGVLASAHLRWLAATVLALPSLANAAETSASGPGPKRHETVAIRVECPALVEVPEARAELEARARVELQVRRQTSGLLVVSCTEERAELSWQSHGQEGRAQVALTRDSKLLVDELISALWQLTAEPQDAPQRPAPSPAPTRPAPAQELTFGAFVGGRLELWPRAPNAFPGGNLGLALLGEHWSLAASVQLAGALDDVAGFRSSLVGGGASLDWQPQALRPLSFGIGLNAWRFAVKAPATLSPVEQATWTLSTSARLRFFQRWRSVTLALGPDVVAYPVRARVLVAEKAVLLGPTFAGAFALELGWLFGR